MRYCPRCHGEYRDEIETCAHCDVPLVGELGAPDPFMTPRGMAEMLEGQQLVPAFMGGPAGLAELRDELARVRVPSVITPSEQGCGTTCRPRLLLLVLPDDLDSAHEIYETSFDADNRSEYVQLVDPRAEEADEGGDGPVECPACGTTYQPGKDEECPECGLFLG